MNSSDMVMVASHNHILVALCVAVFIQRAVARGDHPEMHRTAMAATRSA
jgi:hypothetical protein